MISGERFAKAEHLLKSKEFKKIYKKGLSRKLDGVVLYRLPNALTHNRLGFSLSSRNIKRASRRNRMRRLFREAYRRNKQLLKAGFDIVLVFRKDLGKDFASAAALKMLLKLAGEAGLLA